MSASAAELPIALVIVVFVMGVGLIINSDVNTILDDNRVGNTAAYNATLTNLQTNAYSGFDLGSLLPIVIAAGAVITILLVSFRRFV